MVRCGHRIAPKILCSSGGPGSLASRGANFALQNCDFLLTIGARLDFAITGYAPDNFARAAHKVMVDIDPAEIRKLAPHIQTPIASDAGAFLREMLRQIGSIAARTASAGTSAARIGRHTIPWCSTSIVSRKGSSAFSTSPR